jgi:peptidyl-tRNA hydrolase ICT1
MDDPVMTQSKLIYFFQNLTKVDLRFHLESASWLTDDVKNILKMMHVNQITKEGYLIVKSDRTRSRQLNQADALQKLRQFIWASVDEVRTYLERSQVTQVEEEKLLKAEQRAARERVKSKRIYSQHKQARKPSDF